MSSQLQATQVQETQRCNTWFAKLCRPLRSVDRVVIENHERSEGNVPEPLQRYMLWRTMVLIWVLVLSFPIWFQDCVTFTLLATKNIPEACKCFPKCPITMANGTIVPASSWVLPSAKEANSTGSAIQWVGEQWPQTCPSNHVRSWQTCTGYVNEADDDLNISSCTTNVPPLLSARQPCCGEDEFTALVLESSEQKRAYEIGLVVVNVLLGLLTMYLMGKALQDNESSFGCQVCALSLRV